MFFDYFSGQRFCCKYHAINATNVCVDRAINKMKNEKLKRQAENVKSASLQRLRRCLNEAETRMHNSATRTTEAESVAVDLQARLTKSVER